MEYEVYVYPQAYEDIESIYNYIAFDKLSPETAENLVNRIWDAIESLDTFPQAHQFRLSGKYAGTQYRQLIIDNYICIFRIDEDAKIVYVLTVQYSGRNF